MASPLSDEAVLKIWDALQILAPLMGHVTLAPPFAINSQTDFPETNGPAIWKDAAFCYWDPYTDQEHQKEVEEQVSAYMSRIGCFEGAIIRFGHKGPKLPARDVYDCTTGLLTSVALEVCGSDPLDIGSDVHIWRQFWGRLSLFLLGGGDDGGLDELQWEEKVMEEEKSDSLQTFPIPYSGEGTLDRGAMKNWMDQIRQSSEFILAEGRSAIKRLFDRKHKLEASNAHLYATSEICAKISEKLPKLRQSARTLESIRGVADDNGIEIPLPAELASLEARGGLEMVKRMYKGLGHLVDVLGTWAIQVQAELREVNRELAARSQDLEEFHDGMMSVLR
ncbi:hypothetical protein B0T21DRAFT_351035 [Apiosordaria backusii]|uniref:Uncharacterized protein n=1 Tax=Apiosordaria backusii TaxID=314023 RepID=A0AA40AXN5_9PEZI|nr:hypothetical protein B0T21DRAFT_351035 [Apiosordaria backusii]